MPRAKTNLAYAPRSAYLATFGAVFLALFSAVAAGQDQGNSHRTYIDGPWGQIHVQIHEPPTEPRASVVLIHRMVWGAIQYKYVQPILSEMGVRSIALDLPGYGMSDGPSDVPDIYEYANTLLPILDHLGLDETNILGDHTGASIAVAFAERHPDRVTRLIIHGPPIFDAETRERLRAARMDLDPQADGSHLMTLWANLRRTFEGRSSLEEQHQALLQIFIAGPKEWYAHDAIYRYDLIPVLADLTTTTLVITNKGDSLHDAALQVKAMRDDFDFVEVEAYGTHAIFDHPRPWATALADYLVR